MAEPKDVRRTCSRRAAAGLALVLVLAGCTGSGDPAGTPDVSDGEQTPVVQPTGAGPSGDTAAPTSVDVDPGPDLYRVDPATGETEPILSAAGELHEPERSPQRSQLVYQSEAATGTPQIFVQEHGRTRQLTHIPGGALEPTWSPDGSQIAFAGAVTKSRNSDIFVMDADGTHVHRLAGTPRQDSRPDWSPDGSQIVFDTFGEIWVVSVHDGELTRLPLGARHGPAADPTWSPDGRWIVTTRISPGSSSGVYGFAVPWIMHPDGTEEHALFPSKKPYGVYKLDPSWSPDGKSIAFFDISSSIGLIDMQTGEIDYLSTSLPVSDLSWGREGILVSMGDGALASPYIGVG